MLHLVKYRKLFVLLSLLVIIPGVISLFLYQLNVGIDFAGGTNIEFRPQRHVDAAQFTKMLAPLNLQDISVVGGNDAQVAAGKTIWITLDTQVDANVLQDISDKLATKYGADIKKTITSSVIPALSASDKPYTLLTVTGFSSAPQVSDIKDLLAKLPNTSDPTKGPPAAVTAPTPAATAQPTAKAGTPVATAQPTAQAKATPAVTATPGVSIAATPTPNATNTASIPVSVKDVTQGTTTDTITLLTRSSIKTVAENKSEIDLSKIQATILQAGGPNVFVVSSSEVGPSVASDTTKNAVLAVLAASFFILIYIWFSFRKLPKAWRYGACAIIAILHDVLVVIGIFSILGHFFNVQIDALFITALLTVVGFSVHDTIVVFDRIRENLNRRTVESFEDVVNASLVQTMARSLNTSLTVLFTLLALTLFTGIGTSIHTFTLTLLIGIFSGTYSSIFNASMLLVMWENGEWGFGLFNRDAARTPEKREARELARSR